jgi:hypothetical protein
VALMRGVNLANQAAHSVKILFEKYAGRIPGSDGGDKRRLLEAAMGGEIQNSSLNLLQKYQNRTNLLKTNEDIGRHDWARTNVKK